MLLSISRSVTGKVYSSKNSDDFTNFVRTLGTIPNWEIIYVESCIMWGFKYDEQDLQIGCRKETRHEDALSTVKSF